MKKQKPSHLKYLFFFSLSRHRYAMMRPDTNYSLNICVKTTLEGDQSTGCSPQKLDQKLERRVNTVTHACHPQYWRGKGKWTSQFQDSQSKKQNKQKTQTKPQPSVFVELFILFRMRTHCQTANPLVLLYTNINLYLTLLSVKYLPFSFSFFFFIAVQLT